MLWWCKPIFLGRMKLENEPIWIRRMAIGFIELNKRLREDSVLFEQMLRSCDDDGYVCAKYFDTLIRELDAEGKLPTVKKK